MYLKPEHHQLKQLSIYWGFTIPAIPDLIALEQFRTNCTYESALESLCTQQQNWIQQLHGESRFTLSWRLITLGNPEKDLIFGLVGKTDGQNEDETRIAAQLFFNQVRDALPNSYPVMPCEDADGLAQFRFPFMPSAQDTLAEFSRTVTPLQTISSQNAGSQTGQQINLWAPQPGHFQALFRALACHHAPAGIAINLRPTRLTAEERGSIAFLADAYARAASRSTQEGMQIQTLSTSVTHQNKGLEAEQAAQAWQHLNRAWRLPFEMSISLMAAGPLPQSVTAALQSAISGEPKTELPVGEGDLHLATAEAQKNAVRQSWSDLAIHYWANRQDLGRFPWIFSPEEVHSVFRLPIADRQGVWGVPSAPGASDARHLTFAEKVPADLQLGTLRLRLKDLTQHGLIGGVPGSGKTNTVLYLLNTLWQEHHIPWLVLEPAKTEYRALQALNPDLWVFTLGEERVAPFRFNPFELPPGINLASHQGALVDLFSVSMSMWGPLPSVLEQLMQEAYRRKGFTLLGDNTGLEPPQFSDLWRLVGTIVPRLGYSRDTTDEITAALQVRLGRFCRGALGAMLNTPQSIPFDDLMQQPTLLEMGQITNSDDRAFLMGLILNRCYQYWLARRDQATGNLKHVLVVEEAHNLLADVPEQAAQESANPKGKAVRNFANMLAEVRAFGQGILIADQNPAALVPDVMVNTNLKLAHRVVEASNREALGRAMLLTPQQEKQLASLKVGQMLFYQGGQAEPSLSQVPNFKDRHAVFSQLPSDEKVKSQFSSFQNRYQAWYGLPYGCREVMGCSTVEVAQHLVHALFSDATWSAWQDQITLHILAAPFNGDIWLTLRPFLGRMLVDLYPIALSPEATTAALENAAALIAAEVTQLKGMIHGWNPSQRKVAHQLLVDSLRQLNPELQQRWLELCALSASWQEIGLHAKAYGLSNAPGAFRYEATCLFKTKEAFSQYLEKSEATPDETLKTWIAHQIPYLFTPLTQEIQKSFAVCAAVEVTQNNPALLEYLLPK